MQDVEIPAVAKLVFHSCEFDAEFEEGGAYVLRSFIDCYMLSRVGWGTRGWLVHAVIYIAMHCLMSQPESNH